MPEITLKQWILNKCDDQRGLTETLAKVAGYSTGGNLRKVLVDPKKDFEKFFGLIKIVQTLDPENEINRMEHYALELDPCNQSARFMLSYLELNKRYETLKILVSKMSECRNKTSNEWASVFSVDLKFLEGNASMLDTVREINKLKVKCPILEIHKSFVECYCYLGEMMYDMAFRVIEDLRDQIMIVKERYMRESLYARYLLILAECEIRKNNIVKGRDYCFELINNVDNDNFKALALVVLANSCMTEGHEKAYNYLQLGINSSTELTESTKFHLVRSMNFIDNLWSKTPQNLKINSEDVSDKHEVAHYYIRNKQFTNALTVLDSISLDEMTDNNKGFHFYFRGLIDSSMNNFCESIKYFKKSGDVYFRKLPLIELKKLEVNDVILAALAE